MKTSGLFICLLSLGTLFLTSESRATTYAGQACQSESAGLPLSYSTTGATNTSSSTIWIGCPTVRANDFGTAAVSAVIYFVNDGRTKTCYLDNFNIDIGSLGVWTSASGVSRLVLPTLSSTLAWQPLVLNCSLPSTSKVTGYFFSES